MGLIARLRLVSPRPGKGPVGMSDAASLLLPFAVCALLSRALPADGCLSPPELCPSHPGLGCTACTLPGLCSQPTAKRGGTGVGAEAVPVSHDWQELGCRGDGLTPAPPGGLSRWLHASLPTCTPRAGAGMCVRAGPVAAALTLLLADCGFCLYAGGVR